jgi:toxin FitB
VIVLDTNIVSELQKPRPSAAVEAWLSRVGLEGTFICGPVLMEQAFGAELHRLKSGSQRYLESLANLRRAYSERTLNLDGSAHELAGVLQAKREVVGRPLAVSDSMIAAICLVHDATLATRNVRDFEGLDLKLLNPFEADG